MGIAPAQDSHPRFAKIVAGIWAVFSIVNRHIRLQWDSRHSREQ
jgi:hypothetical protein